MGTLYSCSKHDEILGQWKTNNGFYHALYEIHTSDNGFDCKVIKYNDGTTSFDENHGKQYYLFKDLKWNKESYIDGISGASMKTTSKKKFEVRLLSKDSLEVTSYLLHKPRKEFWTRIREL